MAILVLGIEIKIEYYYFIADYYIGELYHNFPSKNYTYMCVCI